MNALKLAPSANPPAHSHIYPPTRYFAGPQDKLVDLEWGVPNMSMLRPVPALTVVPDYLDAPYGHLHEPTTDKPSHLALHPGVVQHREALLVTTAINTQDTLDGFVLNNSGGVAGDVWRSVSTSVILPAVAATAWVKRASDGAIRTVSFGDRTPFAEAIAVGDTVGLAAGRTAVAIRILVVDGVRGHPTPAVVLKGDHGGLALGAVRLVGYHSPAGQQYVPAPSSDTHLRFAFLLWVTEVRLGLSTDCLVNHPSSHSCFVRRTH
jgi:hypothetical protein